MHRPNLKAIRTHCLASNQEILTDSSDWLIRAEATSTFNAVAHTASLRLI